MMRPSIVRSASLFSSVSVDYWDNPFTTPHLFLFFLCAGVHRNVLGSIIVLAFIAGCVTGSILAMFSSLLFLL